MRTAVDSSVILDVLAGTEVRSEAAETVLMRASAEGSLIVSEPVIVEISPEIDDLDEFLEAWQMQFVPGNLESAALAGKMFASYLDRGGKQDRVVADFLIGAHAKVHADRLLSRDRGYYRDYFKGLEVIEP